MHTICGRRSSASSKALVEYRRRRAEIRTIGPLLLLTIAALPRGRQRRIHRNRRRKQKKMTEAVLSAALRLPCAPYSGRRHDGAMKISHPYERERKRRNPCLDAWQGSIESTRSEHASSMRPYQVST